MKHGKAYLGSISIFAGAVIAILALVRGSWQARLLFGISALWGAWLLAFCLLPHMRNAVRHPKCRKRPSKTSSPSLPLQTLAADSTPTETLLLCHVNHRISAYLKSAYPDITWEWEEKRPEKLALAGGTGRIRVFGVPDFDHADITLDRQANIACSMVRIVPLADAGNGASPDGHTPPGRQPADPHVWYEIQGRAVLETLVADLNSRGHNYLTLHENGDACVEEGQKEIPKEHLAGFPEKVYWPRLVQVLEGNGLAAEITPGGIRISW